MYKAFELKVNEGDLEKSQLFSRVLVENGKENRCTAIDSFLEMITANGMIDGNAMQKKFFPALHTDVFISHSHNDQNLALAVTNMLRQIFDLNVFLDSLFWESADEILRKIDDKYCLQEDMKTYDYRKRNFSTSHIHTILTSAIMKAMDQSEIIIFLNTPSRLSLDLGKAIEDNGYDDYTVSPWIYEEILLTTVLRETDWKHYRKETIVEEGVSKRTGKLNISYRLPKDRLIPLTVDDLVKWHRKYTRSKEAYSTKRPPAESRWVEWTEVHPRA